MMFLKVVLILIEILCSLLLIGVVLLQKSKGEGLGMAFGAEMGESLFGARAANVLVKITIWLSVIFMLNTVFLARIYSKGQGRSVMERLATPAPVPAPAPVPQNAAAPAPAQAGSVTPAPAPAAIPAPAPAAMPVATPISAGEPPVSAAPAPASDATPAPEKSPAE